MVFPALSVLAFALGAPVPDHSPAPFPTGAVAADHEIASRAGVELLRAGGNAVDAAVAASFTLSVVRPQSCGIGGGGFMVIHLKDDPRHGTFTTTLNYRETCPRAYGPDFYKKDPDRDASSRGGKSVAVPGTVAGLLVALEKYGTKSRAEVLAPAIRSAEQGFTADKHYVDSVKEVMEWFDKAPDRPARSPFFFERYLLRGTVKIGDVIRVPEQAAALRLIAQDGADGFYKGAVAAAMLRAIASDRGGMTAADLDAFTVIEAPPLVSNFMGRNLSMMPPPSSGGIVIAQVTEMLELRNQALRQAGLNSAPYVHLVTEALKHAFADRAAWLGDPAFVDVPVKTLLDPAYIKERADLFDPGHTLPPDRYGTRPARNPRPSVPDDHGTSHLSAVDSRGNAVACTETVNLIFGSLIAVPEYGFVLNDEMDDFSTNPGKPNAFGLIQSSLNAPAPGKRPLSSMTPMIATDESGVLLVAGGSGGPRIITGTLEAALNVLVFDLGAEDAVTRPRFHHQWQPDSIGLEDPLRNTPLEAELKSRYGHATDRRDMVGTIQLIRRAVGGTGWDAASDPRKGGVAAGY